MGDYQHQQGAHYRHKPHVETRAEMWTTEKHVIYIIYTPFLSFHILSYPFHDIPLAIFSSKQTHLHVIVQPFPAGWSIINNRQRHQLQSPSSTRTQRAFSVPTVKQAVKNHAAAWMGPYGSLESPVSNTGRSTPELIKN